MRRPLKTIESLIHELPDKDAEIAEKFLRTRDFESLLELVESDMYLIEKHQNSDNCKEEFKDLDITLISELRDVIQEYMSYIYIPEDNEYRDYE